MPGNLSKEAMVVYFKTSLNRFHSLKRDERAQEGNNLLSYILNYFDHFIQNFGESLNFIKIVEGKCVEFIMDEKAASDFPHLIETCIALQEKLSNHHNDCDDRKRNRKILDKFKNKLAAQKIKKAESAGLVG